MTLEECLKKDGKYILLECKDYLQEFELIVKSGKETIFEINYGKYSKINEKDFSLKCDLHEDNGWEKEE